jgi:hypothetical protein
MTEPGPRPDDPRFDVDAIMRRAEAENAAEIAEYGTTLPGPADWAEAAYDAFGAGNDALDAGDYAAARDYLWQAVTAGIEEARPQLDEAEAWLALHNTPNTDPEGPET